MPIIYLKKGKKKKQKEPTATDNIDEIRLNGLVYHIALWVALDDAVRQSEGFFVAQQ